MAWGGTASIRPMEMAASASGTKCMPSRGSSTAKASVPALTSKRRLPSSSRTLDAQMVHRPGSVPNQVTPWTGASGSLQSMLSSPFRIRRPSGLMPSRISSFALRMPSRLPRFSMCMVPMLTMAAISGRPMLLRYAISRKWFMPISSTATSVSSGMDRMAMGIPMSLLWFAGVFATLKEPSRTVETISLVVDLPTEPVMATALKPRRLRSSRAIRPRAMRGSSTMMAG